MRSSGSRLPPGATDTVSLANNLRARRARHSRTSLVDVASAQPLHLDRGPLTAPYPGLSKP